jgi:hypothetical protein
MNSIPGILFALFFFTAGMVLVVGAHRRWDWLVNPPDEMWPYYSQAFIKKLFGKEGVIVFTYCLGILFMVLSLYGLFNVLKK